ncbi:hypothetical protein ACHAQH_010117 [Verticillium albo-atrum]
MSKQTQNNGPADRKSEAGNNKIANTAIANVEQAQVVKLVDKTCRSDDDDMELLESIESYNEAVLDAYSRHPLPDVVTDAGGLSRTILFKDFKVLKARVREWALADGIVRTSEEWVRWQTYKYIWEKYVITLYPFIEPPVEGSGPKSPEVQILHDTELWQMAIVKAHNALPVGKRSVKGGLTRAVLVGRLEACKKTSRELLVKDAINLLSTRYINWTAHCLLYREFVDSEAPFREPNMNDLPHDPVFMKMMEDSHKKVVKDNLECEKKMAKLTASAGEMKIVDNKVVNKDEKVEQAEDEFLTSVEVLMEIWADKRLRGGLEKCPKIGPRPFCILLPDGCYPSGIRVNAHEAHLLEVSRPEKMYASLKLRLRPSTPKDLDWAVFMSFVDEKIDPKKQRSMLDLCYNFHDLLKWQCSVLRGDVVTLEEAFADMFHHRFMQLTGVWDWKKTTREICERVTEAEALTRVFEEKSGLELELAVRLLEEWFEKATEDGSEELDMELLTRFLWSRDTSLLGAEEGVLSHVSLVQLALTILEPLEKALGVEVADQWMQKFHQKCY